MAFRNPGYSWRHQLKALAEAGFRAVAPDMRGYGETDRPEEIESTPSSTSSATWSGSWTRSARRRRSSSATTGARRSPGALRSCGPDRFRGVAGLSVPFLPRSPQPPTRAMPRTGRSRDLHALFQEPGVAEARLSAIRATRFDPALFRIGDAPPRPITARQTPLQAWFRATEDTSPDGAPRICCPAWLTEADVDFYANEFARTGFRSGLNWYRNMDRDWELMAPFAG